LAQSELLGRMACGRKGLLCRHCRDVCTRGRIGSCSGIGSCVGNANRSHCIVIIYVRTEKTLRTRKKRYGPMDIVWCASDTSYLESLDIRIQYDIDDRSDFVQIFL
jgi:hypothetical protein